ncbi:hypothetical protein GOBAR_DD03334 [Gossypium barbadense]|nr:hypothetical protein GOBAR_DD03334 [Gossypium barbadense]
MESFGGSELAVVGCAVKKKRSGILRRPRVAVQTFTHNYILLSSPTPATGCSGNEDQNFKSGSNGFGSENKLKLKLKLGGVTRTIQTNSTVDHAFDVEPGLTKSSHFSDVSQTREKSFLLNLFCHDWRSVVVTFTFAICVCVHACVSLYSVSFVLRVFFISSSTSCELMVCCMNNHCRARKAPVFQIREKAMKFNGRIYPEVALVMGKGHSSRGKATGVCVAGNETDRHEPTRKSKRVPKRRVLDVDEEDERNGGEGAAFEDRDYVEEDECISDDEPGSKRKKLGRGSVDLFVEGRTESTPTTRNRALQSGKDLLSGPGAALVEFPDGLPPAPSKKQKEKLSEVELQLKKAEAAQRRRMQSEKAARDAEAEAIRKILGQDSARKKKEDKMKKQRDELAQGKATKSETLASNTVRWVMGPGGTTVIFSEDIGLPQLFNSVPSGYFYKSICLMLLTIYIRFLQ